MAAFIAKQMVGNQFSAVKGKFSINNIIIREDFRSVTN